MIGSLTPGRSVRTAWSRWGGGLRGMQTAGPGKEPRACTAYPGMGPLTVLLRGNTRSGARNAIAFSQPQDQCYAFFRVAPAAALPF